MVGSGLPPRPGVDRVDDRDLDAVLLWSMRMAHAVWLAVGVASLAVNRRTIRRPGRMAAAIGIAGAEWLWSNGRAGRAAAGAGPREGLGDATRATAAAVSSAVLAHLAVGPEVQFGDPVAWSFHLVYWTVGANALRTAEPTGPMALAAAAGASYAATMLARPGHQPRPQIVAKSIQIPAAAGAAVLLATSLRTAQRDIRLAEEQTVRDLSAGAAARARLESVDDLYAGARRTLARVDALLATDPTQARVVARREIERLRALINTDDRSAPTLSVALDELVRRRVSTVGPVEITADLESVPPEITAPVTAAVDAVLGVLGRRNPFRPCVVRAVGRDGHLTVTVRQQGGEVVDHDEVVGEAEPVLAPSGGRMTVWSAQGRGVRVTLEVDW